MSKKKSSRKTGINQYSNCARNIRTFLFFVGEPRIKFGGMLLDNRIRVFFPMATIFDTHRFNHRDPSSASSTSMLLSPSHLTAFYIAFAIAYRDVWNNGHILIPEKHKEHTRVNRLLMKEAKSHAGLF